MACSCMGSEPRYQVQLASGAIWKDKTFRNRVDADAAAIRVGGTVVTK